jgi:hypothetical protein
MNAFEQLFDMYEWDCFSKGILSDVSLEEDFALYRRWLVRHKDDPEVKRLLEKSMKEMQDEFDLFMGRRSLLRPKLNGTVRLVWQAVGPDATNPDDADRN